VGRILCTFFGRYSPKQSGSLAKVDCLDRMVVVSYFGLSNVRNVDDRRVGLPPHKPLPWLPLAHFGCHPMERQAFTAREESGRIMIIRLMLIVEAIAFLTAALTHFGILIDGYKHRQAANAESVIGLVLFLAWICTFVRPAWAKMAAVSAHCFAVLGTAVGIFTIVVGVGPPTMPDIVYHACILPLLLCGLSVSIQYGKNKSL
jgi:hypothetical protein